MRSKAIVVTLIGLCCFSGCRDRSSSDLVATENVANPSSTDSSKLSEAKLERISRFCGDCHPLPLPETFPKSSWNEEVRQGFDFYIESKRTDLEEPIRQDVVRYYQDAAPVKVVVPRADSMKVVPSPIRFVRSVGIAPAEISPATAHLVWNGSSNSVFFTEMRFGSLREWRPNRKDFSGDPKGVDRMIATGKNVCRVHICDWNGDGREDYMLGELGSFPVGDHENGLVTLHLATESGGFERVVLGEKLGRVVEAKPFDYDDDGDLDVLVAEFGWRKTGGLKLLRNVGGTLQRPKMEVEVLDPRHGSLGVEIVDMDGDEKLDFVVAYAQEFETVEVSFNRGAGKYEKQIVLQLPDPSYNSSSFQIVDLDRDGLLDIVHTCGDVMDAYIPKPYHGIRWVRNLGRGKWENRELGLLVGALQSTVADFDGDGDLDIAAVGLFPQGAADGPGAYDSICWWEQRDSLEFIRHSVERDHCAHASCTSADINDDGRIDLIVGEWLDDVDHAAFRVFLNLPNQ